MRSTIDSSGAGKTDQATDVAALDDALFGVITESAAVALVEEVACLITSTDIEAAFHSSHARYEPGGLTLNETTLLLLKGGLAFLDLVSSPLDMRLPQSSETTAGWTRWRENESGIYEIEHRSSGTWSSVGGVEIDRGAQCIVQLAGTRVHSSAWSSGSTMITRHEALVLTDTGEFELRGSSLSTFGGDVILSSRMRSSYSEWSSVDAAGRDKNDDVIHDRYALLDDGLTLEIHHADGRVERHLGFSLGGDYVLDGRRYSATGRNATLSRPGDAATATHASSSGTWLALIAEADEERERREGGSDTLDPDVIAREAARRAR